MLEQGMYIQDRYEIIEAVGAGGMSNVYKAKDHILGRFVAIKVLKQEYSEDRNFVVKFRTEAQSAAGLEHPNIVNIYDVGSEEGMYFIVMEYVEGITLKTYIEKKGQLSFKEADSIAIQVARGIEAAHNKNIIHRDIKPQNIMISTEGKVKVTDFGIAKAISSNTVSSDVMGSVHYTSPEHARNGYVDGRSDIYSLGIVMYEMVTGRVPFDGETTVAVAIKHLQEEMVKPSSYAPDLPISMEKVILKCTQKNPERRYQTIADLLTDLRKCLVTPNEDFVVIAPGPEAGTTKIITQEELKTINDSLPEEDSDLKPVDGAEDLDDDDVADDNELSPKMNKAMTIMLIAIAVIIVFLVIFVIGTIFGWFKGKNKTADTETQVTETQLETETSTEVTLEMIDLVGMSLEDAQDWAGENGLQIEIVEYRESDEEDGTILEQAVEEGDMVKSGDIIQVVVAGNEDGSSNVTVPNVVGFSENDAVTSLKNAKLTYEKTYEYSADVEAGLVIKQSIAANQSVPENTKIVLTISQGAESVSVPNVVGMSEESAQSALEAKGFIVQIMESYSDTVDEGYVISTDPEANKKVQAGSTITMIVSQGQEAKYKASCTISGLPNGVTSIYWELQDDSGTVYDSGTVDSETTVYSKLLTTKAGTKFVIKYTYTDETGNSVSDTKAFAATYN